MSIGWATTSHTTFIKCIKPIINSSHQYFNNILIKIKNISLEKTKTIHLHHQN
jgi:hypothetical protein